MSQATGLLRAGRDPHVRIVGAVSAAHFVSHYYIILLAPLLPFVRADYGVSYTEIGFAFRRVQHRLRHAADAGRLPGRPAGRAHPAHRRPGDRRQRLRARRPGAIRSGCSWRCSPSPASATPSTTRPTTPCCRTTCPANASARRFRCTPSPACWVGAVAPPSLLMMHSLWGWRGAFIGAGVLGLAVAALLLAMRDENGNAGARAGGGDNADKSGERGRRLATVVVAADPAQSRLLRAARHDQRRHLQLFGGGARRAVSGRR